jgi:hypothetical protein
MLSRFLRSSSILSKGSVSRRLCNTSPEGATYGDHVFRGVVAAKYLKAQKLPVNTLDGTKWTTDGSADKVC